MKFEAPLFRVGFGIDAHQFSKHSSKKRPLYLGGILIDNHQGLKAHSDGDVVLHSLCDALLGALALENLSDIGDLFPDNNAAFQNMRSENFVFKVMQLITTNNFKIGNIDITIQAQTPKLKGYKLKIKQSIASMLNISSNQVNIKATTTEKMDDVGKKKGIYCHSMVLIYQSTSKIS